MNRRQPGGDGSLRTRARLMRKKTQVPEDTVTSDRDKLAGRCPLVRTALTSRTTRTLYDMGTEAKHSGRIGATETMFGGTKKQKSERNSDVLP